ncbi:MAG: nuclear transport factor 2 family protein [Pseudomonadota bacterium]
MDQQQARSIADRYIAGLHRVEKGDAARIDNLVDLFADNAELTNTIIERDGSSRCGRAEIAEFWRKYRAAFGDIHSEFSEVTASDHSAGLFWRSVGTGTAGQPLAYEGVSLLVFNDAGKIARFKGYFDSRQMTFRTEPRSPHHA